MVCLIVMLLGECWHEKGTSVVELKQKMVVLRRRISSFTFARGGGEQKNAETSEDETSEDNEEGEHGSGGTTTIEMRKWSMPNNPVCSL